jgi:hypothetical protein
MPVKTGIQVRSLNIKNRLDSGFRRMTNEQTPSLCTPKPRSG